MEKYVHHMSGSSLTDPRILRDALSGQSPLTVVTRLLKRFAFWTAIVLPFLHLSLLATGLDSRSATVAFVGLVGLNVCALLLGHPYGQK